MGLRTDDILSNQNNIRQTYVFICESANGLQCHWSPVEGAELDGLLATALAAGGPRGNPRGRPALALVEAGSGGRARSGQWIRGGLPARLIQDRPAIDMEGEQAGGRWRFRLVPRCLQSSPRPAPSSLRVRWAAGRSRLLPVDLPQPTERSEPIVVQKRRIPSGIRGRPDHVSRQFLGAGRVWIPSRVLEGKRSHEPS